MNSIDNTIFVALLGEAHEHCFGYPMKDPLSEPDSRQLASEIADKTGLIIGWKSLKNYSAFILDPSQVRKENPSASTLDTLARYVLNAPKTDEITRKENESHNPWWYRYREKFTKRPKEGRSYRWLVSGTVLVIVLSAIIFLFHFLPFNRRSESSVFVDRFSQVNMDSLLRKGWMIKSIDPAAWNKRDTLPGCLTLYTLKGDNWPDSANRPEVRDLLLRKIGSDCFTAEIHFKNFIPSENWQQAGLLLLEDSSLTGKSLRFSLAYNDYFGGMSPVPTILLQAIFSSGSESLKPEELIHESIFSPGHDPETIIRQNLQNSALRIEKQDNRFRLLFSDGVFANSAFKEELSKTIDFTPRYIGIISLKGFVNDTKVIPVHITFFSLISVSCNP